jgi:riboflavin kinase/FMN adenylyltransferase
MIENINRSGAVVCLGMFDGVHMGHRTLLNAALLAAKEKGLEPVVFTFKNHPMTVLGKSPKLLMTYEERFKSIKELGISRIEAVQFDMQLASMDPYEFVKMLSEKYSAKHIVAGFNYSFGRYGMGNSDSLTRFGRELGFEVQIIPPVIYEGNSVSSTRIRECLENGNIKEANEMLQSPYTLNGKVISNLHIGTRIGFPTANIAVAEEKLLPLSGVYAAVVKLCSGKRYYAVTNIGKNPTVRGSMTTVESHLLDFAEDIYDTEISVMLYNRIRDEIKFPSVKALASQISDDRGAAERYFKRENPVL